jgi:hypothetical protein
MDLTAYQATTLAANRTEMSQFGVNEDVVSQYEVKDASSRVPSIHVDNVNVYKLQNTFNTKSTT